MKISNIFSKHFYKISLWLLLLSLFSFCFSLHQVFFVIPDDYLQGSLVKIFYIHVPSAWLAIMFYFLLGLFSILYLVFKNHLYFIIAKSVAYTDVYLAICALVTGSVWGKPAWGTWWIWDARLTSMFILLCFTIVYFVIIHSFNSEPRSAKASSVFAVIGLINLPIIKFSVYLWATLHQKSTVFTLEGTKIHHSMLLPLISMFFAILLFALLLIFLNIKVGITLRKVKNRFLRE